MDMLKATYLEEAEEEEEEDDDDDSDAEDDHPPYTTNEVRSGTAVAKWSAIISSTEQGDASEDEEEQAILTSFMPNVLLERMKKRRLAGAKRPASSSAPATTRQARPHTPSLDPPMTDGTRSQPAKRARTASDDYFGPDVEAVWEGSRRVLNSLSSAAGFVRPIGPRPATRMLAWGCMDAAEE
jgi:hypothetical protein